MLKNRYSKLTAFVLAAVFVLSGCSAMNAQSKFSTASSQEYAYPEETVSKIPGSMETSDFGSAQYQESPEAPPDEYNTVTGGAESGGVGGAQINVPTPTANRKIIITVNLSLQTKEFESGIQEIASLTDQMGGYIQDSYVEGSNMNEKYIRRNASYTVRIPVENLNTFLESIGKDFNVVNQQQSANDISTQYFDSKARLESLRVQQERLVEMLKEATELQYMLEVERELAQVLYEIESYTSALNRMDDSVDMSTLYISLQEVVEYEDAPKPQPVTFGQRMRNTFGESWDNFLNLCQGFVLVLIALIPFLPLFVVIGIIIFLIVRRAKKCQRTQKNNTPVYPYYSVPPYNQNPTIPRQDNNKKDGPQKED